MPAAVALPAGHRGNGTGFGVTLIGPPWTDKALLDAGRGYFAAAGPQSTPPLNLETA